MEHPDRAGLHWQPLAATEREVLFDRVDAFLAARARFHRLPPIPDEPAHVAYDCPDWDQPGERSRRHYRYGPGVTNWCPQCAWEEPPC